MTISDPRRLLGDFLRAHRERLPPPAKASSRRRTPGWRREELADAAGVSATWITWLEQGREVSASPATLARLASALGLSAAERASLFELADRRDPAAPKSPPPDLPPAILALPSLMSVPAYLLDHLWTARAWNDGAAALFPGWLEDDADTNLLRFVFLSPAARRLIVDWRQRSTRLAAEFRADYSRRHRDPALQDLVERLCTDSADFNRLWRDQDVLHREGGDRDFDHPKLGRHRYRQTTLAPTSHPDCKLVCLAPVQGRRGSVAETALPASCQPSTPSGYQYTLL
jgi:transcriptional regulator with XRE-family HTH domain